MNSSSAPRHPNPLPSALQAYATVGSALSSTKTGIEFAIQLAVGAQACVFIFKWARRGTWNSLLAGKENTKSKHILKSNPAARTLVRIMIWGYRVTGKVPMAEDLEAKLKEGEIVLPMESLTVAIDGGSVEGRDPSLPDSKREDNASSRQCPNLSDSTLLPLSHVGWEMASLRKFSVAGTKETPESIDGRSSAHGAERGDQRGRRGEGPVSDGEGSVGNLKRTGGKGEGPVGDVIGPVGKGKGLVGNVKDAVVKGSGNDPKGQGLKPMKPPQRSKSDAHSI